MQTASRETGRLRYGFKPASVRQPGRQCPRASASRCCVAYARMWPAVSSSQMQRGLSSTSRTTHAARGSIGATRRCARECTAPLASGNRRATLWLAAATVSSRDLLRGIERDDAVPACPQASEGNEIVAAYRTMGFTLGRHPLALRCGRLARDRLQSAGQRSIGLPSNFACNLTRNS